MRRCSTSLSGKCKSKVQHIPPHSCLNGFYQKVRNQWDWGCVENGGFNWLLVAMYIGAIPMEYLREVSHKISNFWIFKGNEIIISKRNLYSHIHCISINSSIDPAAAGAKSFQSCSTLCDPIDSSPPGSPFPGILQARTLKWVTISFSNTWKWKVKVKSLSRVRLFETPWTAAYQAPLSMGFSRQEYWSVLPFPPPSQ